MWSPMLFCKKVKSFDCLCNTYVCTHACHSWHWTSWRLHGYWLASARSLLREACNIQSKPFAFLQIRECIMVPCCRAALSARATWQICLIGMALFVGFWNEVVWSNKESNDQTANGCHSGLWCWDDTEGVIRIYLYRQIHRYLYQHVSWSSRICQDQPTDQGITSLAMVMFLPLLQMSCRIIRLDPAPVDLVQYIGFILLHKT